MALPRQAGGTRREQPIGMFHCESAARCSSPGVPTATAVSVAVGRAAFRRSPSRQTTAPTTTRRRRSFDNVPGVRRPRQHHVHARGQAFPLRCRPPTVDLAAVVDKGRCSACTFEFTDWRAENARDEAVKAHLSQTTPYRDETLPLPRRHARRSRLHRERSKLARQHGAEIIQLAIGASSAQPSPSSKSSPTC